MYLEDFKSKLNNPYAEIFPVSAMSRIGLEPLVKRLYELVQTTPEFPLYEEEIKEVNYVYENEDEILINKKGNNVYIVEGKKVDDLIAKINTTTFEGMNKVLSILNKLGMEDKLREKGINNGDTVRIGDVEFEYFE